MKTSFLVAIFGLCSALATAPRVIRSNEKCGSCKRKEKTTPAPLGLRAVNGKVMRGNKVFCGIGVNYFDAFYRTLLKPGDTSYREGFATLKKLGIPFARLSLMGYWPSESTLYFTDKIRYFAQMDDVVKTAQRNNVGLIPSLFLNTANVPDLMKEPLDAWGNPDSKTRAFMRTYTREVVTRYKNSPAIWGWEFGNELNLAANLPNAAEHRAPVVLDRGTMPTRSQRDDMTSEIMRAALTAFAQEVRAIDKTRLISSGNAFPRLSAWHNLHKKTWDTDEPQQWATMLLGDNPDPLDTICVHAYEDYERIGVATALAMRAKKPLFIGEFGVEGTDATPELKAKFAAVLAAVESRRCAVRRTVGLRFFVAGQRLERDGNQCAPLPT